MHSFYAMQCSAVQCDFLDDAEYCWRFFSHLIFNYIHTQNTLTHLHTSTRWLRFSNTVFHAQKYFEMKTKTRKKRARFLSQALFVSAILLKLVDTNLSSLTLSVRALNALTFGLGFLWKCHIFMCRMYASHFYATSFVASS